MKLALPIVAVLSVGVLPAHSADPPPLMPDELHTLTLIDQLPTRGQILAYNSDPVPRLVELALTKNVTIDFGVRLRATRALPQFCATSVPDCQADTDANMSPIRATIREVITSNAVLPSTGQMLLQLRAGIEALGAIHSGKQSDVDLLVPFLDNPSRDIRFATARALRELCIPSAETPLRNRYEDEPVSQVRLAISAALGDLEQCSQ
jgi:hypothetical protein